MKLADLAKKAASLPELSFEWPGPEQFHESVFKTETATHAGLVAYVDQLRRRMAEQSLVMDEIVKAYRALRDLILEAEVS